MGRTIFWQPCIALTRETSEYVKTEWLGQRSGANIPQGLEWWSSSWWTKQAERSRWWRTLGYQDWDEARVSKLATIACKMEYRRDWRYEERWMRSVKEDEEDKERKRGEEGRCRGRWRKRKDEASTYLIVHKNDDVGKRYTDERGRTFCSWERGKNDAISKTYFHAKNVAKTLLMLSEKVEWVCKMVRSDERWFGWILNNGEE